MQKASSHGTTTQIRALLVRSLVPGHFAFHSFPGVTLVPVQYRTPGLGGRPQVRGN